MNVTFCDIIPANDGPLYTLMQGIHRLLSISCRPHQDLIENDENDNFSTKIRVLMVDARCLCMCGSVNCYRVAGLAYAYACRCASTKFVSVDC